MEPETSTTSQAHAILRNGHLPHGPSWKDADQSLDGGFSITLNTSCTISAHVPRPSGKCTMTIPTRNVSELAVRGWLALVEPIV